MVSKCGEGGGLLHRIGLEGNKVAMYIQDVGYQSCWSGILPKIKTPYVDDKDALYIFDSSGLGSIADGLRKRGNLVFGASGFQDKLENDREFGFEVMRSCGIKIPPYQQFSKIKDAKEYAKRSKCERLVFKPCGDLPSKLTYCASDLDDLLMYLDFIETEHKIDDFILQDYIEGKIVSSEVWFDGKHLVKHANQTVEVKKFMNDEIGPSTGCSGNSIWFTDFSNKIVKEGVAKVKDIALRESYVGCIDLNTIVAEDGIYGLEWTPRFGLDAMPTFFRMLDYDAGQLLYEMATGNGTIGYVDGFGSGVRLSIPPYPIELEKVKIIQEHSPNKNIPIRIPEKFVPDCYFYEVMLKDKQLVHSDGTGVILVANGVGYTIEESLDVPYKVMEACKIPDKQYRTDLKSVLSEMYNEIKGEM